MVAVVEEGGGFTGFTGIFLSVAGLVLFRQTILLTFWLRANGTSGPNRFGEDPKGGVDVDVFS